jgi:hypothetical protein
MRAPAVAGAAASVLRPLKPTVEPPTLLSEATAACKDAHAGSENLCAGTVDAFVWGDPLVIMNRTRNTLG